MRFVTKTPTDLQVIIHHFKRGAEGPEFVLFPMVHIGTEEYFHCVMQRLAACDVILVEGIKSRIGDLFTLPYRIAARSWRIRLHVQQETLNLSGLKDKIIKSDLDPLTFTKGWSRLTRRFQLMFVFAIPLVSIYLYFFCNRKKIANLLTERDRPSTGDPGDSQLESFRRLIGGDRNEELVKHIKRQYDAGKREKPVVGVLYGAKHMSRVAKFLTVRLGYKVNKKEHLTVFEF